MEHGGYSEFGDGLVQREVRGARRVERLAAGMKFEPANAVFGDEPAGRGDLFPTTGGIDARERDEHVRMSRCRFRDEFIGDWVMSRSRPAIDSEDNRGHPGLAVHPGHLIDARSSVPHTEVTQRPIEPKSVFLIDVVDDDSRSGGREAEGVRAPRTARDDRHFALQIHLAFPGTSR